MSGNKLSTDYKQVLYIVSFLQGPAYEWIHLYFKDFLQNAEGAQKAFTKKIFKDYESLFNKMEEVFDNGDKALEADRDIRTLR
jgi:translation initiation factor 2 alpha subunit (eIF-2alpha)